MGSIGRTHVILFYLLQTFHTPSFGDEEFDIPPINPHQAQQQPPPPPQPQQQSRLQDPQHSPNSNVLTYQQLHTQPSMGMNEYQQQPQYQYSNQTTYMTQGNQMMMMPQQQQQQQQIIMQQHQQQPPQQQGVYIRSSTGNSPPMGHETTTTSEDSDDSTPHPAMVSTFLRPSPSTGTRLVFKKRLHGLGTGSVVSVYYFHFYPFIYFLTGR